MSNQQIILKQVKVHNLKSVDLTLDRHQFIVFTGVSGSGKSSLAFDTLYVEGQRRYVESLSTQARRQLEEMAKPDLESAEGLTPTISIEQKTAGRNPRSTVGTLTEVYDYLRVLFARIGIPHCPVSGEPVRPQSREKIIKTVQTYPDGMKVLILAPYISEKKGEFKDDFDELRRQGFTRIRLDGQIVTLDEEISLDGSVTHSIDLVIDRLKVDRDNHSRIAESITQALNHSDGTCIVLDAETQEETLFSMHAYSPKSGLSYRSLEPHDFSFNSPSGMCERCHGLGHVQEFNLDAIIDPNLSIAEDCCSIASSFQTVRYGNIYRHLAEEYGFSLKTPWKKLSKSAQEVFLSGTKKKWTRIRFVHPKTGAKWVDHVRWRGVLYEAHRRFTEAKSETYRKNMQKLMTEQTCSECGGSRLKPYPAATQVGKKRIQQLAEMTIEELHTFFTKLKLNPLEKKIALELIKEIVQRLHFLLNVGLNYLTLDRTAPTLSGGEAQRVRLASQIGCGLVGITYVLDEPSIGLHPRDNHKLIATLKNLRDMGNTVIVVEHDEETILEADRIVDVGPGPGVKGGEIVCNGTVSELLKNKHSLTGAYLSGRKKIPIPRKRRKPTKDKLILKQCSHNNLKAISPEFPLGLLIAITGVSGSGKSSLISDTLHPALAQHYHNSEQPIGAHKGLAGLKHLDKVIAIDQSPIGRNPRSNPGTYIKVFDDIRRLFSELPESKARGYTPGQFSFNVREGSCPECRGMGMIQIDMDFMEDEWITCPTCLNRRFDPETLAIYFKGKNIHDILNMDVYTALQLFENQPTIRKKLEILSRVGLEYLQLGQPSPTLSGGEAQRIKLAKELVRPATGRTLYILDEPTTGLHFHDISHLLAVLNSLVDQGNTVVVIEHNMDVVKTADWILDLGPEGGHEGGELVASGPPEKIAKMDTPTGRALKPILSGIPYTPGKKQKRVKPGISHITIKGAEQNNLKRFDVTLPRHQMTICTGPSGSGKTSLAIDTIYAEGQRRYAESLSAYARQFVKMMPKPIVEQVEGLSPAIAIEQKAHAGNPRSTIGTMTEIYDYLRLLYAHLGIPHSPETGEEIRSISKQFVVDLLLNLPKGDKVQILAPTNHTIKELQRLGFVRIRLNGTFYDLDSAPPLDPKRKNTLEVVVDRLKVDPKYHHRMLEAVQAAATLGKDQLTILHEEEELFYNLSFCCPSTGKSYPKITPQTFSFNKPEGMCPDCLGLGYQYGANLTQFDELLDLNLFGLFTILWGDNLTLADCLGIDPHTPLRALPKKDLSFLFNGSDKWLSGNGFQFRWVGLNEAFSRLGRHAKGVYREQVLPLLDQYTCVTCSGERLNALARHVTLQEHTLPELCHLPISDTLCFIEALPIPDTHRLLLDVKASILSRLKFLSNVGLHYLALDRSAPTLSGGETQRIRLARQLGSGLTGVLYILDEPTIGLHPKDNDRLLSALNRLKDLGNTLVMVEHDPQTIAHADYILDFGPKAGLQGGHITAQGTYKQILKNKNSLTGRYLSGELSIPIPTKMRKPTANFLSIHNATKHNLKDISLKIPVGLMTALTGVSGSGKSTLLQHIIQPAVHQGLNKQKQVTLDGTTVKGIDHFERLIVIDQNPIGHTIRSDVATYTDVLTPIRSFFAQLPEAQIRGLMPKHFSYNHRKGMCTNCWGLGHKKVELHFLPPVRVTCEQCQGLRLNPVSLNVTYSGKNLGQLLSYTIAELRQLFANHPRITRPLDTLIAVGLDYLKLGQEVVSLSGGEAQRIKLSRELSKRSRGKTLYLLDEPTTGLHFDDIQKLLTVLHRLADKGNTLLIIEHNLDVIKNCDHLIELGPEAGAAGGHLLYQGPPASLTNTPTAPYLKLCKK